MRAMEAFWKSGYAATSLDDLSAATGMNRPSLYAAFGDKQDIYVKAYRKYRERMREEFRPILASHAPLREALRKIFEACRDLYLSGPDGPRGCLTVVTAASEAVAEAEIRALVIEAIAALDETFAALFSNALNRGELPQGSDPSALAKTTTALIYTLALRARARTPKGELSALIDGAIVVICGPNSQMAVRSPAKKA